MEPTPKVVIIELGSRYTLLVARALRELGVRSVVLPPQQASEWFKQHEVSAVVFSGGEASVHDENAPEPPEETLSLKRSDGRPVPVLGICYGMQWLAKRFGGEVRAVPEWGEYGETELFVPDFSSPLFARTAKYQNVWSSHGDTVFQAPPGFLVLALSSSFMTVAAMSDGIFWGVQFHPEVTHTFHGRQILANFLFKIARCERDWKPSSVIAEIRKRTLEELGGRKVILAFSGGVDSTVAAKILSPVLGNRLLAVTVDGGQFREGELAEIRRHAELVGVQIRIITAHYKFDSALEGITDAEEKRRRFQNTYEYVLEHVAREFGGSEVGIIQGTLAPDRIESGATGGVRIKTHHNVGLSFGKLLALHPFGDLFKDEVRALGKEAGLPESVWNRKPFPGPGLFACIVGVPVNALRLALVRRADSLITKILKKRGLYDEACSQLVVSLWGVKTVGVKGYPRAYANSIVVKAVQTVDFMTARAVLFPPEVVREIASVLTKEPGITRVLIDVTDKPPGTIIPE